MQIYHLRCELITTCPLEQTMRKGAEIEYNIKWLGLPIHWKTLISEYEPPASFVDQQEKGPYTLWRHHHTFEETSAGTRVGDHVEYALPLGVLGEIAHAVMVKRQLEAIFRFRQREIGNLLAGKTVEVVAPVITT